ncbi:MAG: outer membrane lipoprotein-sorting protein [Myxococcales bacterium]|nr:outer membrane lipoprotein-sorting protein [Myxococcales bacterium]
MLKHTSRRTVLRILVGAGALAFTLAHPLVAAASDLPPADDPRFLPALLDAIDDLHRGDSSHALMQMKVQTKHWTRSMAMESWSRGEEYSLVRILEPKKERGTATLKVEDDLFTYLSKTGRTIKITGAMMGGSWMGSHFTNDDLVKGTRLADDFDAKAEEGPAIDGEATYKLTLTPKPDAPVVWGKIEIEVRKSDLMPARETFYDEDGAAVRLLEFTDFRAVNGRTFPARMKMTPLDKPGEYTEIRYAKIEFDVGLKREFFTLQRLQSL